MEDLQNQVKQLTAQRDSLLEEVKWLKIRYGEHLDRLNNELVAFKSQEHNRIKGFIELMIQLQDIPFSDLKMAKSSEEK